MQLPKTTLTKTLFKRSLALVILAGLMVSPVLIFRLVFVRPAHIDVAATANSPVFHKHAVVKQEEATVGLPMRLTIPTIGVDAPIEHVGLTADGEMGTPKDPYNAAWYKSGPSPGEDGSSVIDGHYGLVNGKPAAFDNLYKLRKGDKIYVQDEKGITVGFVVRALQTYSREDDAKDVFVSSDRKAHLNLITCAGTWDKASRNYTGRIVVFTNLE